MARALSILFLLTALGCGGAPSAQPTWETQTSPEDETAGEETD